MSNDILIVDDETDIRELVSDILGDGGYSTRTAANSDTALKAVAERVPSLLLLDIWLQGSELDGLGILELVKSKYPNLPVLMISGHGNIETAVNSIRLGAYDFIEKPFKEEKLLHTVARALEHAKLRGENEELRTRGKAEVDLIGDSQAVTSLKSMIQKVAPTQSRVLLTGGAGAGKEMVARLIHQDSERADGPFVTLNAAGLTADRVESELFGVEDSNPNGGAKKLGLFEKAHGGTLFIDEVTDLPFETQGRLLRSLQDRAFTRLRGNKPVDVDVRVLAASNRELKGYMDEGKLREDLYYRLNVVPMQVPSLKERRSDIPALCDHFLKQASQMSGLPTREMSEEAMAILQAYEWPGNVRQLRNMMEWLLIMSPGDADKKIDSKALPSELFESSPAVMTSDISGDILSMPLREARELFERQYLAAQINRFGGNISRTSNFVGMERSALHRKLKLLGLSNSRGAETPEEATTNDAPAPMEAVAATA
ncbi:MAG: sigma-54 dependent transcriptional regulator [Rickettsiales bacterium]|nr:sigma-54 dependent transcriptional regulator [Rickettsiales bacterium]